MAAYKAVLLEVDNINLAAIAQHNFRAVGIGELGIVERTHLDVLGVRNPLVDFIYREQLSLLAGRFVYQVTFGSVLTHKLVAPPCTIAVLGHHVVEVLATEVQVFKCKLLLLLSTHSQGGKQPE